MMRSIRLTVACVVVLVVTVGHTHAAMITTTFAGGNNENGNMFDVETFANPLTVTGLTIHKTLEATSTLEVYLKSGTYVGSETTPADWTLVSTDSVTGAAGSDGSNNHGVGTFVDVTDFVLSASSITGFYVTFTGVATLENRMNYTNGAATFSNSDIELTLGVGAVHPFVTTFDDRIWNGTIHYDVGATGAVPEPSTLALWSLGTVTLVGLGWRRRKRAA